MTTPHRTYFSRVFFASLMIVSFGFLTELGFRFPHITLVDAAEKSFSISASQFQFTPSLITVTEGDTVNLTLSSTDVTHGFAISEFGVSETLLPGETKKVSFIASKAGTFSMTCNVFCGSGHSSMTGKLIVEPQSLADTEKPAKPINLSGMAKSTSQIDLTWDKSSDNVGVTAYVVYRNSVKVGTPTATIYSDTLLSSGTTYSYQVAAVDASGNESEKSIAVSVATQEAKDETAPTASAILVSNNTSSSAKITWNTDERTKGQIEYGVSSGQYTASSALEGSLATTHSASLSNLTPETTYFFRVKNTDESGNLGLSIEQRLTTIQEEKTVDRTAPQISSLKTSTIEAERAMIEIVTSEEATVVLEYGTASGTYTESVKSEELLLVHSVTLTGLKSGTLYFYRAKATDAAGNFEFSSQQLFTTPVNPKEEEEETTNDEEETDPKEESDQPVAPKETNSNSSQKDKNKTSSTLEAPTLEFVEIENVVTPIEMPVEPEDLLDEATGKEREGIAFTSPEGEPILFKGKTIPDATVILTIKSDPITISTTSDSQGNWSTRFDRDLAAGTHTVTIAVRNADGEESDSSLPVTFEVQAVQTLAAGAQDTEETDKTASPWSMGILFVGGGLLLLAIAGLWMRRKKSRPSKSAQSGDESS